MKIKPLHDWAVISRSEAEEKTIGGIIIPDTAKEKPAEGIVEAIGPGKYKKEKDKKEKKFIPTVLKPGQRVVFIDYMAKDFEVDGHKTTMIREEDILGIYEHGALPAVKKEHSVTVKKEMPVLVTETAKKEPQPAPKSSKTVSKKKPAAKKAAAPKKNTVAKTAAKKKTAAPIKKTAAKKPVKKKTASAKTVAKKKGSVQKKKSVVTGKKSVTAKKTNRKAPAKKSGITRKTITTKKTAGKTKNKRR